MTQKKRHGWSGEIELDVGEHDVLHPLELLRRLIKVKDFRLYRYKAQKKQTFDVNFCELSYYGKLQQCKIILDHLAL